MSLIRKHLRKITVLLGGLSIWVTICSCGSLLYPERQGQANTGKYDPMVLVMDGFLCLFFIIPGVIAFLVDFNSGAIYLPQGEAKLIKFNPDNTTVEEVEALIKKHTGKDIKLNQNQADQRYISLNKGKKLVNAYSN
ncbi:MAG: hypothetical protein HRT89_17780 [Lentisphaeria bacterium]|nr:hypothetical protein [Lentisphaeria bacterium]NQZ69908.1 hypothetical protein [Lentisphaeria bacterium]